MNARREKIEYWHINHALRNLGYSAKEFWGYMGVRESRKRYIWRNIKEFSKTEESRLQTINSFYKFIKQTKPTYRADKFIPKDPTVKFRQVEPTDPVVLNKRYKDNMRKFDNWVNEYNSMQKQEVVITRYYKI